MEFAKSELQLEGLVFAIVIRFDDLPMNCVKTFVLNDWKTTIGDGFQYEIEYVEDFIFDLRQQSYKQYSHTEDFLLSIKDLSIGPLRTKAFGVRMLSTLDLLHDELHECQDVLYCSAQSFSALLGALV